MTIEDVRCPRCKRQMSRCNSCIKLVSDFLVRNPGKKQEDALQYAHVKRTFSKMNCQKNFKLTNKVFGQNFGV